MATEAEQIAEVKQLLRDSVEAAYKSGGDPRETILKALNESFCAGLLSEPPQDQGARIAVRLSPEIRMMHVQISFGPEE